MSRLDTANAIVSIVRNVVDMGIAVADARRRAREEAERKEKEREEKQRSQLVVP